MKNSTVHLLIAIILCVLTVISCNKEGPKGLDDLLEQMATSLKDGNYKQAIQFFSDARKIKETHWSKKMEIDFPHYQSNIFYKKKDYENWIQYSWIWIDQIEKIPDIPERKKAEIYYIHGTNCLRVVQRSLLEMEQKERVEFLDEALDVLNIALELDVIDPPGEFICKFIATVYVEKSKIFPDEGGDYLEKAHEYWKLSKMKRKEARKRKIEDIEEFPDMSEDYDEEADEYFKVFEKLVDLILLLPPPLPQPPPLLPPPSDIKI